MSEARAISDMVRAINEAWMEHRFDDLTEHFDEAMTLAMPGFEQRVEGREPIIASYRDFANRAEIRAFRASEPRVDVLGPSAVATTSFEIEYERDGEAYRESGTDLLVLQRTDDQWRVIWRTVVPSSSERRA